MIVKKVMKQQDRQQGGTHDNNTNRKYNKTGSREVHMTTTQIENTTRPAAGRYS
jgi:hypothetical protein